MKRTIYFILLICFITVILNPVTLDNRNLIGNSNVIPQSAPILLAFSTYLGGSTDDDVAAIAVDTVGSVYIIGHTRSNNFPCINAYDATFNGGDLDIFVAKLANDGQSLIYSTYLGGSGYDYASDIVVDALGCVYITGSTDSSDFPLRNAYQAVLKRGDVFVTKLSADGRSLIYSTFFGGTDGESGTSIFVDSERCVYITGATDSTDFPTVNAYDATFNGNLDGFISKFASNGQSVIYSTYFGGIGHDNLDKITVDAEGCAYIIGKTFSADFPTFNAYDATYSGVQFDVVAVKLAADGKSLLYSTYLGGSDAEFDHGIAVDAEGCAYILGWTSSADFPTVNAYNSTSIGDEVFVTKLAADGQSLIYSTYLGGSDIDRGGGIAVDDSECIYIVGSTQSTDFPIVNAYDTICDGMDVFMTKFSADGQSLIYSTFLGGSGGTGTDYGVDIAIDTMECAYITGYAISTDFPTIRAYDATYNGGVDVFITKLEMDTDDDGMIDGWEFQMGLNATDSGDAVLDKDTNGMPNLWEYYMDLNATDPTDAALDSDTDGLTNLVEFQIGTNARIADTDADLMPDGWEFRMAFNASNPADAILDNDGDGLKNLEKFYLGTSPLNFDTDDDLIPDGQEYQMGLNATDPLDAALDFDGDGLSNYDEYLRGTSIWEVDSDFDGWNDLHDPNPTSFIFPWVYFIVGFVGISVSTGATLFIFIRRPRK